MNLAELLDPASQQLLDSLPPYDSANSLALGQALRDQGVSTDLAAALLTQSKLRAQAVAKFGDLAHQLLFTQDGLEQATRNIVAQAHARRYLAAGCSHIADLTCGIGADSLAFAQAGMHVTACELDNATAQLAAWNLRNFPNAKALCGNGIEIAQAGDFDGLYADPARRAHRSRKFNPDDFLPPLGTVLDLRHQTPALGVKVGPGISHDDVPTEAEAQWVSVNGDVVECGLWFGPLAPQGPGRTALLLHTSSIGTMLSRLVIDDPAAAPLTVGPVGEYLYEPDKAVIRAGLLPIAAAELGAHQVDPTIAYLTSDRSPSLLDRGASLANSAQPLPLATAYRVIDVLPFGVKQLKAYLKQRQIGRLAIKKRGTAITPEQLRPQLQLKGPNEGTIVLTRIASKQSVLVVEPGNIEP